MTQGRPPNDEVAGEDRDDAQEPHPGARSQTRAVPGERGARTAPRAAFGPASNAPPVNTDGDKTVKRPYPTAWGQTLPIGGAAMEEKTKVARNVFSQTLGGEPAPAPQDAPSTPSPGARSARPQAQEQELEPLRVPSQSPSPAPFQQSRGSAARTILMAGAPPAPEPAAARPPARQPGASAAPKPAADAAKPASRAPAAAAKRTLALGSAEFAAESRAPADLAPSGASDRARPAPFAAPRAPNISEPLQLQLDARDVLEHAEIATPRRGSRGPLFAGIAVAVLIAGAIAAWIGSREKAAPVAEPSLRGEGVLVQDSPQAAAPAAPGAPATAAPAPAEAPPAAQPEAAPARPEAAAVPPAAEEAPKKPVAEAPKAEAKARPEPKPASKPAARKRPAASAAAVSDEPVSEDVRSARDALRALDSEPVMKIQRSDDDWEAPAPEVPDTPDLPEPPPAPEE